MELWDRRISQRKHPLTQTLFTQKLGGEQNF